MSKQMDPEKYRQELRDMGASRKDADAAAEQLRRQQEQKR